MPPQPDGWEVNSKFILNELERLNDVITNLSDKIQGVQIEVATLNTTAKIWGGVAGFICGAIVAFVVAFVRLK